MARNTTANVAQMLAINLLKEQDDDPFSCLTFDRQLFKNKPHTHAHTKGLSNLKSPGSKSFRAVDVDGSLKENRPDKPVGAKEGEALVGRG